MFLIKKKKEKGKKDNKSKNKFLKKENFRRIRNLMQFRLHQVAYPHLPN